MTKRSCPFDDEITRQVKKHVNSVEGDKDSLKIIHENTLKKLMNGAHLVQQEKNNRDIEINSGGENTQKSILSYFSHNQSYKDFNRNNIKTIKYKEPTVKCFYCDKFDDQGDNCCKCGNYFCTSCAFSSYETNEHQVVCISCSSDRCM